MHDKVTLQLKELQEKFVALETKSTDLEEALEARTSKLREKLEHEIENKLSHNLQTKLTHLGVSSVLELVSTVTILSFIDHRDDNCAPI